MSGQADRQRIRPWRLLVQSGALLLIIVAPFLNFYWQINFIQGWYQSLGIGKLWFVSPLEGLESILVAKRLYLPLLVGMAVPVVLALFLGRVFCGWICPIHFLSDLSDRFLSLFSRKKFRRDHLLLPRSIIWYVLLMELLLTMILGAPLFVFLSPPGLVGRELMLAVFFHTLSIEGLIVVAVLLANLLTRRFFCRYFCPLGALLAFLGSRRKLRVKIAPDKCKECGICHRACPLGLDPALGEAESSYCWNCGECVESCREAALRLEWE